MDQSQHTLLHVEGEAKLLILLSLAVTETNSGTNKYFLAILIPIYSYHSSTGIYILSMAKHNLLSILP